MAIAIGLWMAFAAWRIEALPLPVFDETFHAHSGAAVAWGLKPTELSHPPLVKDAIAASMWATGTRYDPAGNSWRTGVAEAYPPGVPAAWRWPSLLAAGAALAAIYALARGVGGHPAAGWAAMGLLMLDGCFFVHARTGQTNAYEVAGVLAATAAAWRAREAADARWLWLGGTAIGLAAASRWSAFAPWALIGAWLAWGWRNEPALLLRLAAGWLALPAAVYTLTWAPLVANAGGLLSPAAWRTAFVDGQLAIYEFHANLREVHAYQSPWWSWPLLVKPVWYAFTFNGPTVRAVWAIGNAAVWWASLPALLGAAWAGRRGDRGLGLVAWVALGTWGAWALQPRSMVFAHYYLPTAALACAALGAFGWRAWRGSALVERTAGRLGAIAFVLACVAWFAFYYPVLTAMPMPGTDVMKRVWFGEAWM